MRLRKFGVKAISDRLRSTTPQTEHSLQSCLTPVEYSVLNHSQPQIVVDTEKKSPPADLFKLNPKNH